MEPLVSKTRAYFLAFAAILFSGLFSAPASADHPEAEKLLPEKTVLFIKLKSVEEFTKSFMETGFMKMLQDEKLQPVVESLYGSVDDAYAQVEDQIGVSLGELQTLLKGEVSFAIVSEKDRPFSIVLLADYKGNADTADKLLSLGEERAAENGTDVEEEEVEGVTIRSLGDGDETVHYFQKDDTLCASNNADLAKLVLARWMLENGEELSEDMKEELADRLEDRVLKKNRKFLNVMNACDPDEDNPPQGIMFADVFEIIKSTQSGVAGTALVGILRGLGVDGLLGVGASMTANHEEYESIIHMHVALANPRAGIIKMLAIEPGDLTPEDIFPPNVSNYFTANWNVMTSFNEIEKIYDLFNGEGALAEELEENFTENFGVDLKEDIIASLDGRISFAQVNVESGALNGQATIISAKLKDPGEFEDIFADLREGIEETAAGRRGDDDEREAIFTPEKYKGVEYFVLPGPPTQEEIEERRRARDQRLREAGREVPERRNRVQFQIRRASPCLAIVGDYLVFTDSVDFMRDAIASNKNPEDILADDPDYKKLLREVKRQLDGRKPALITFQRPVEAIRLLYEAVQDEQTQSAIKDRTEDNPFFQALNDAFVENELPDFEDLEKYFKPTAGVMTNDETGWHYMAFSPKIEEDE